MDKNRFILYCLFSALLLTPAWYQWGTGLILLIALVPLLSVEDQLYRDKVNNRPHKFFLYSFFTFLIWNGLTSWWIWNASPLGMIMALIINSFQMSIVMWLFHITRRNAGDGPGYFGLIVFWLVYEHFYMNGEITWPWMNLGNGFANDIHLIQWYEYTGAFGGTLWVLLSNVIAFYLMNNFIRSRSTESKSERLAKETKGSNNGLAFSQANEQTNSQAYSKANGQTNSQAYSQANGQNSPRLLPVLIMWSLLLILPVIISLIRFNTYTEKEDPVEIVVVQPNIDPYNEKFMGLDMKSQMVKMLKLAASKTTSTTEYIVVPETFINDNVWLHKLDENPSIRQIKGFMEQYPRAQFIVGMTCFKRYMHPDSVTATARQLRDSDVYYDSFNSSIQIDSTGKMPIYHKSKLVVGVEKMPYPQYLKFLRKLTLKLGGAFRSHGTQEYRNSFPSLDGTVRTGTPICYESVFGEFVTEYVNAGATLIFVITNDGWWGDTPGYRQHNSYSRLRAIETRRSIARSANTGTSSFINQKGQVLQATEYWTDDAIKETLNSNTEITFYTRHGDFIPRIAYFFSLIIILYTLVRIILKR